MTSSKNKPWVLVLEDDVFLAKAYHAKLAHDGIEAKIVDSGEAAAKVLAGDDKPFLILLDLMLPGENGFDLLQKFNANSATKGIPVIILSNLAQDEDVKRGVDLGAKEYLIKSNVKIETIVEKIKQYLPSSK